MFAHQGVARGFFVLFRSWARANISDGGTLRARYSWRRSSARLRCLPGPCWRNTYRALAVVELAVFAQALTSSSGHHQASHHSTMFNIFSRRRVVIHVLGGAHSRMPSLRHTFTIFTRNEVPAAGWWR